MSLEVQRPERGLVQPERGLVQPDRGLVQPDRGLGNRLREAARAAGRGLDLIRPAAEPVGLYRRVRLAQAFLPPVIALVVVLYQLYVVGYIGRELSFAFWAEVSFYGIAGPFVTYFVIGWIGAEIREREKAEHDLRELYLELAESHRRLGAIQRVTKQVSEASELGAVLDAAILGLSEAVGARAGAIALEGGTVRAVGLGGEGGDELPREVLDLEPLRQARSSLERPSGWSGARHRLSVPLRWGPRFFGAVHTYFEDTPRRDSRELLEILTNELAAAIEAAEHRSRDLITLYEVDRSIRAETNLERLLEAVLGRIRERVRADAAAVYLADEDGTLRLAYSRTAGGTTLRRGSPGRLAREVASARASIAVADCLEYEPEDPALEGSCSALGLPLVADLELVGVLVLGARAAGALDERELPLLSLLAHQVTLAVRNARAYLYSEELAILDERNRIAREIHDGIAQSLAFTALKLDLAGRLLATDPERVRAELETARNTLREQIREVRRSIFALRPIDLERLGFLGTVRGYVTDFGEQNGLRATLEVHGEPALSSADEVVMFRILQESLNNVAKHAAARSVRVTLLLGPGGANLAVQDDGRGFDPASLTGVVSSAGGLGLGQMRERVDARGGRFEFASAPGAGTRVTVSLPGT